MQQKNLYFNSSDLQNIQVFGNVLQCIWRRKTFHSVAECQIALICLQIFQILGSKFLLKNKKSEKTMLLLLETSSYLQKHPPAQEFGKIYQIR